MRKTILQPHYICCVQKTAPKKSYYSKIKSILKYAKIGHDARAIDFGKWSVRVKNKECQKDGKNYPTTTLELLCGKNRSYKHLILKNLEEFKNGQNWPRRKGYRLRKMVSLGKKLKMPQRCKKRFYYHIKFVLCKKPLLEEPYIQEMRGF